jgi:integrase
MSVKPRGKKWQAYVTTPEGDRYRKTFSTNAEATLWEAQVRHALEKGLPVPKHSTPSQSCNMTIGEAMENANQMYWSGGKSEQQYAYLINTIRRVFGAKTSVEDITTNKIDDWIVRLKQSGSKASTINKHLNVISRSLRLAHEQERLSKMPKIRRQAEPKGKLRYFTKEEEQLILLTLKSWNQSYLYDCAVVACDTGMRAGELLKFDTTLHRLGNRWGVYIPDRKNGEPLLLPVTNRVYETLQRRKFDKHPSKDSTCRRVWARLRNQLHLEDTTWHTWRHTCASRLVQGGMDIYKVKEWMGHEDIKMTMRYAHLAPTNIVNGCDILESVA